MHQVATLNYTHSLTLHRPFYFVRSASCSVPCSRTQVPFQPCKYLDLILYSREQIILENKAMGKETTDTSPWGLVSIKGQDVDYETPMQPITMMRNALGKEHGGSGVGLDRTKYDASVAFWTEHASIQ